MILKFTRNSEIYQAPETKTPFHVCTDLFSYPDFILAFRPVLCINSVENQPETKDCHEKYLFCHDIWI